MLKQKHYAHERRTKNRDQKRIKERLQIQAIIDEFLSLEELQQAQQSEGLPSLYNQVTQHLDQHKIKLFSKKQILSAFPQTNYSIQSKCSNRRTFTNSPPSFYSTHTITIQ